MAILLVCLLKRQAVRKFPLFKSCNFNYPSIPGKMTGLVMQSFLRGYLQKFVQVASALTAE